MKIYHATMFLAGFIALAVILAPIKTWAGNMGAHRSSTATTCKSGVVVRNPKACKENGGKW